MSSIELSPRATHVWYAWTAALEQSPHREWFYEVLSPEERRRHDRFKFQRHRHIYLVAHALVRSVLSRYASDIAPHQWSFAANQYGCPRLTGPSLAGVRCNLSHTSGLVAFALSRERDVGVDVEDLERPQVNVSLADRYFSPSEVRDLYCHPEERQRHVFFDYWTLKEAYIKAREMGLSLPLDHFSYHLRPQQPITISFVPELDDRPEEWQFAQHRPAFTHVISLAVRRGLGADLDVTFRETSPGPPGAPDIARPAD